MYSLAQPSRRNSNDTTLPSRAALLAVAVAVPPLAPLPPMSVASMAALTAAFAWVLTRPIIEPFYRTVLIPGSACSG
jgi:hypothetical protein